MQCGWGEDERLINGDLYDVLLSQSVASSQLSAGSLLPCPFSRAALLTGAATAALFHLLTLVQVASVLLQLVRHFHLSKERWWATFAGRYALLVTPMSACALAFNCLRLVSLTRGVPAAGGESPLLARSFSPRAGGNAGASVLLFLASVTFIAAVAFSVRNTVHAAVLTSTKGLQADGSRPRLPLFIRHFTTACMVLIVWNAGVWSLLFALPAAAASAAGDAGQTAIGLLLMSLGSVSYWLLARSIAMATQRLSESLRVGSIPPHAVLACTQSVVSDALGPLQPPPPTAAHGLNAAQVEKRQQQSFTFFVSSRVIRLMLGVHVGVSVGFFVCCLALPAWRLQAYWLYFAQCYWALVVLLRFQVLVIPQPS